MNAELIARTCTASGELLIAYSVMRVHHRISKDKKIDESAVKAIGSEHVLSLIGMALIVLGYLLEVPVVLGR